MTHACARIGSHGAPDHRRSALGLSGRPATYHVQFLLGAPLRITSCLLPLTAEVSSPAISSTSCSRSARGRAGRPVSMASNQWDLGPNHVSWCPALPHRARPDRGGAAAGCPDRDRKIRSKSRRQAATTGSGPDHPFARGSGVVRRAADRPYVYIQIVEGEVGSGAVGQLQRARIPQAAQQSGYGERPVEGDVGGLLRGRGRESA